MTQDTFNKLMRLNKQHLINEVIKILMEEDVKSSTVKKILELGEKK